MATVLSTITFHIQWWISFRIWCIHGTPALSNILLVCIAVTIPSLPDDTSMIGLVTPGTWYPHNISWAAHEENRELLKHVQIYGTSPQCLHLISLFKFHLLIVTVKPWRVEHQLFIKTKRDVTTDIIDATILRRVFTQTISLYGIQIMTELPHLNNKFLKNHINFY